MDAERNPRKNPKRKKMRLKKDNNHNEIEKQWEAYGWITIDTSGSRGKLLDFIAYKRSGEVYFVEVKNGNATPTKCEKKFIAKHPERSVVVHNVKENLAVLASIERKF
jgi:Holliday junction resolvase